MFYKFGDQTKAKTIVKSGSEDAEAKDDVEIFDKNDDKNRRSLILNKYEEEEKAKEE